MNQEDIEKLKKTGKIAAQVLEYGKGLIKKDASMTKVLDKIEEKITELGAKPAFPAQISCNHLAAHYCPDEEDKTVFSDQLACLDVGVHVDGFIGDTAVTVDLSGKNEDLVKASREALENAIKTIKIPIMIMFSCFSFVFLRFLLELLGVFFFILTKLNHYCIEMSLLPLF